MAPKTTDAIKNLVLGLLPEGALQSLKKIHYARMLRSGRSNDERELEVLPYFVRPGDHVVDIGANIGVYAKRLSELVGPAGRVYGVEPIPQTFAILKSNVHKLGLDNVELVNCALSNANQEVVMEIPAYQRGGENFYQARIVDPAAAAQFRRVRIPTLALDTLLYDCASVSFIKCDVEGHELRCLQGADGLIRAHHPAWMIEISGDPDEAGSNAAAVFDLMAHHGYAPFLFEGALLRRRSQGDDSVNYFFLTDEHIEDLKSQEVLDDRLLNDSPVY
jgi:FkbM family methyltransferase